jgi:hypothetical protein
MWIFARKSFLSIVEHADEPRLLLVRARFPGDIEHWFPEAQIAETPEADYRFRTALPRERVAEAVALRVRQIDYPNFKAGIDDLHRHIAYTKVWSVMKQQQTEREGDW